MGARDHDGWAKLVAADVSRGSWIASGLSGWGVVRSTVPAGFEAYARILHPASASRIRAEGDWASPLAEEAWSWARAAEVFGGVVHPLAQWGALAGELYQSVEVDGWSVSPPGVGRSEPALFESLLSIAAASNADVLVFVALWEGWNNAPETFREEVSYALASGERLSLPGRDYVVLTTSLGAMAEPGWLERAGIGWQWGSGPLPQLVWPDDQSWCIASEIDFDSTLVGGSRQLIDRVLVSPALEAFEVSPDGDLSSTGDTVNRA